MHAGGAVLPLLEVLEVICWAPPLEFLPCSVSSISGILPPFTTVPGPAPGDFLHSLPDAFWVLITFPDAWFWVLRLNFLF